MSNSYTLNDPPGSFLVFGPDGGVAFDSRLMSQRIHLTGSADLSARVSFPLPGGGVISGNGGVTVPYNKVFTRPPYVLSASRKLASDDQGEENPSNRIYPPRLIYRDGADFLNYLHGAFTNANTTSVFIGNANATGQGVLVGGSAVINFRGERRAWYAVFENEVA